MKNRKQRNAVTTMLTISISYLICWLPSYTCFLMATFKVTGLDYGAFSYINVFLILLNVCMNPFIYATRHEAVKKQLLSTFMLSLSSG